VTSYEWWQPAIDTHNGNHGGDLKPVDIRKLKLADLPSDIDIVVGSPPCTEFSYANRGGRGDLAEGLKDLVKFFEVVNHLKPRFWAMENVPRVVEVIRQGMATPGHALYRFRHLGAEIDVFDFSEYGAPQARRRCIATNIPLDDLKAFKGHAKQSTLGDVVRGLAKLRRVVDPVWGVTLSRRDLTEMEAEQPLNAEELRMNREAKEYHPVYNNMSFPDRMDERARTVTATCTRVSRESIVIQDPKEPTMYRRLTIRERACLQGFPITYQFFARSFSEKAKMIGNAIPPTFTYLVALAAQGVSAEDFDGFEAVSGELRLPDRQAPVTLPDKEGRTYPVARGFRAALPGLRFKSGMRFELANVMAGAGVEWSVRFFFGPSKDIRQIELDGSVTQEMRRSPLLASVLKSMQATFSKAERALGISSPSSLQSSWTRRAEGLGPYGVVDILGEVAEEMLSRLVTNIDDDERARIASYVLAVAGDDGRKPVGRSKLEKNALPVLVGILVGEWFNNLSWHVHHKVAA
jgi:DNA (cytosine-5)-methyltransferase 1